MGKKGKGKAPEVCENCRWWEPIYDTGTLHDYDPGAHTGAGERWRHPPQAVQIPGVDPCEEARFINPETGVNARCGEFKAMKSPRRPA